MGQNIFSRVTGGEASDIEGVIRANGTEQIDKRLQIVGAQWKSENLPQMLQLRSAYLNGQLAVKL